MKEQRFFKITLITIASLLTITFGCGYPSETLTIYRTVEQTALVTPPSGPHGKGKMLERGDIALEGGYTGAPVIPSDESRYEGQSGHEVAQHTFHGRLAFAARWIEFSFEAQYTHGDLGAEIASDTSSKDIGDENVFRVGFNIRAIFAGNRDMGFGGLWETSVGNIPYYWRVYERAYLTVNEHSEGWWDVPESRTTMLGSLIYEKREREIYPFFRTGLFGTISPVSPLNITFGALVQNQPRFFGVEKVREVCHYYESGLADCHGETLEDIDTYKSELIFSLFASVSLRLGAVTLIGQLVGHPISTDQELVRETPFTFDLSARINF